MHKSLYMTSEIMWDDISEIITKWTPSHSCILTAKSVCSHLMPCHIVVQMYPSILLPTFWKMWPPKGFVYSRKGKNNTEVWERPVGTILFPCRLHCDDRANPMTCLLKYEMYAGTLSLGLSLSGRSKDSHLWKQLAHAARANMMKYLRAALSFFGVPWKWRESMPGSTQYYTRGWVCQRSNHSPCRT